MTEEEPLEFGSSFDEECCVVCKLGFHNETPTTVSEKGIKSLISFSKERRCFELHAHLTECINSMPLRKVLVHKNCRRDFTNKRRSVRLSSTDGNEVPQPKRLRSSISSFNWKENCIFCGEFAKFDSRHPERNKVHKVTTLPMHENLLECCHKRGDKWSSEVENCLHGCIDLVAAEAIYHVNCYTQFLLNKGKPFEATGVILGRPQDKGMLHWFHMLCHWLETKADAELFQLYW